MGQAYPYITGAVILLLIGSQVVRKNFDPFAPIWLFLAGYTQVYVIQAISYRDYALRVRGEDLVASADLRALWALLWFLAVYYCGLGKKLAIRLPRVPSYWSSGLVSGISPFMIGWGLICAGVALRTVEASPEQSLLRQFPIMMLAAGVLMTVTGRQPSNPRPFMTLAGVLTVLAYVLIWTFNGRRSHAVIGVLTGVCGWYVPRWRRPNLPVMAVTAIACVLAVSLALGWRNAREHDRSAAGFVQFLSDFNPESVLVNLNIIDRADLEGRLVQGEQSSKETEEYGGFLLMMYAVPELSSYDYGESYLRVFSTFIPRLIWKNKPIYGRERWIQAWIAGSEFEREEDFTGPAIGILGATQLNGGAIATVIVLGLLALGLRTAYDYFRYYCDRPWAQFWWAMTFYVAWLTTVNDDPLVWFYYIYGHTTLPPVLALWLYHRFMSPEPTPPALAVAARKA